MDEDEPETNSINLVKGRLLEGHQGFLKNLRKRQVQINVAA